MKKVLIIIALIIFSTQLFAQQAKPVSTGKDIQIKNSSDTIKNTVACKPKDKPKRQCACCMKFIYEPAFNGHYPTCCHTRKKDYMIPTF